MPQPSEELFWQFNTSDRFYVNFYHTNYRRFEDYPFGLLNVVGYWAEAQIFGGVVLFERGESNYEVPLILQSSDIIYTYGFQIINAFLHPQNTFDAFQLSEKQIKSFVDVGVDTVLPFAKEPDARAERTFVREGEVPLRIYKNEYDKQPESFLPDFPSCVRTEDDGLEKAMKIREGNGRDKEPFTYPPLSRDL